MRTTEHYRDRGDRLERIQSTIGMGEVICTKYIDRGHPNGAELHSVTDTGVIIVSNARTHKRITVLVARPSQLKRLGIYDRWLLDRAYQNQCNGYNYL